MKKWKKKEQELLTEIYQNIDYCVGLKQRPFHYFDDKSFEMMINESVRRANSYNPPQPANDWRIAVNMPETEDKLQAILGFITANRPRVEISARSEQKLIDKRIGKALDVITDASLDSEDGDMKMTSGAQEVLTKGTVVMYEGYEKIYRTIKDEKKVDKKTGKVTYTEKKICDSKRPIQRLVPIENFYIPNFYEVDLQKQGYVIEREEMNYHVAAQVYGNYPNWKHVQTSKQIKITKEGNYFFYENWGERVYEETVEILHWYHRTKDLYIIVINGVLMTEIDNPIPFKHKNYPFSYAVCQRYAPDFFWGKSLSMRLLSRQDFLNNLVRLAADRGVMSLLPWFVTSEESNIMPSDIGPMEVITVSDVTQFREAKIDPMQQGDVQLINMFQDSMSRSAVDPSQQGQVTSATATAVQNARESAINSLGLIIRFLSWMTHNQTRQRISNILQYHVIGDLYDNKMKNPEFRVSDKKLSDGTMGDIIVRIVADKKDVPSPEKLAEEIAAADGKIEVIYVTIEELHNIDFYIKIIPTSRIAESRALTKALFIEAMQLMMQMFPDMVNRQKLAEKLLEVFDLESDLIDVEQLQEQMAGMMNPEEQQMMPQEEMPDMASQIVGDPLQSLGTMQNGIANNMSLA